MALQMLVPRIHSQALRRHDQMEPWDCSPARSVDSALHHNDKATLGHLAKSWETFDSL